MKYATILLQLLLAVGAVAGELTFEQAWQRVARQHPLMAAAKHRLEAARFDRLQADQRPNPRLLLEAENIYGSGQYQDAGQIETALIAEQTFERGGKRAARRGVSEQKITAQRLIIQRQLRQLRQQVREHFNHLLQTQEQLALLNGQQEIADNNSQIVARLHRAGAATADDLGRAQLQQKSVALQLTRAKQQLHDASQQLAALWGDMFSTEDIVAAGPLLFIPERVTAAHVLAQLDSGIDQKIAQQQVRWQQAEVGLEKANSKVDVTLEAGVRRFSATDEYAFTLGASMPLPVFNNNQSAVDSAYAHMRAAQNDADYIMRKTSAEVLAALRHWQQADRALATLEADILPAAKKVLSATDKAYQRGSNSYLQVLDAQSSLLQTQRQRLELRADAAAAMAIVERYITPLNTVPSVANIPQEPTP